MDAPSALLRGFDERSRTPFHDDRWCQRVPRAMVRTTRGRNFHSSYFVEEEGGIASKRTTERGQPPYFISVFSEGLYFSTRTLSTSSRSLVSGYIFDRIVSGVFLVLAESSHPTPTSRFSKRTPERASPREVGFHNEHTKKSSH